MNEYSGYRYPQRQVKKQEACRQYAVTALPSDYTVGMLYVPMQTDITMFDEMKAFDCGTLFCVLNKPFAGKCCK